MMKLKLAILLTGIYLSLNGWAGNLYSEFPEQIDANDHYVFYSHGLIVEGDNPTPVHGRWGKYDFPAVKQALQDDAYNLIAYHRPKATKPREFAIRLAADIDKLVKQGVPYKNITVLGFSRGGEITALTSNIVASNDMNIIILAACAGLLKADTSIKLYGNVYSIYETSDGVGSCQFVIDRSPNVQHFSELAISTGLEHGAFYQPIPQWVEPLKSWLKNTTIK